MVVGYFNAVRWIRIDDHGDSVMVVRPNGGTPGAATALEEYETRYFGRPIGHSLFLILEDNPGIIGVSI